MISSVTQLSAFGPSCITLFISQVTTGYDPMLTPKGVFGIRGYEGVDPCFLKSRRAKCRDILIWRRTSFKYDGPKFTRCCCGPQVMDALVTSCIGDMRELLLALRNHDGREGGEPNHAPGVPFRWMTETAP
jgi:hypothetical protein